MNITDHVRIILNKDKEKMQTVCEKALDVLKYGCESGVIPSMICCNDTTHFYNQHKEEVSIIVTDTLRKHGGLSPAGIFGNKWDSEDPFVLSAANKNLLAWFAFENACHEISGCQYV